jgi:predicted ATPase
MITRIAIENFKGIGDRIEVPIRPITLLFGPNSAGKSSIMHAIHYAREVLERHNLDADRTITGGDCVNLGGFREMVHRHESSRQIKIRFDLDLGSVKWHERFPVMEFPFEIGSSEVDLSTLGLDIMSGWVEVTIGYDNPTTDQQPVVLAYEVGLDDIELVRIEYAPMSGTATDVESQAMLTRLNLRHPVITWPEERSDSAGPIDFLFPEFHTFLDSVYYGGEEAEIPSATELEAIAGGDSGNLDGMVVTVLHGLADFSPNTIRRVSHEKDGIALKLWVGKTRDSGQLAFFAAAMDRPAAITDHAARTLLQGLLSGFLDREDIFVRIAGTDDALPTWGRRLRLDFSEIPVDKGELSEEELVSTRDRSQEFVEQLLTRLVTGPGELLRELLAGFRYVGPIREIPPTDHTPPRFPESSRWASGLAAWDLLADPSRSDLISEVSAWLWNEDRLNTGHQLVSKLVRNIATAFQEEMLRLEWEDDTPSVKMKEVLAELEKLPVRQQVYLRDVEKNIDLPPYSVGVGISQVVPVITAIVADGAQVVQIEQPALHLHPTQQAAAGDLIVWGAARSKRTTLLIETQSEHLILRILKRIRQTSKGTAVQGLEVHVENLNVLYVEPHDGQSSVFEIGVSDDGELLQPWPDKFFDQDYEERYG